MGYHLPENTVFQRTTERLKGFLPEDNKINLKAKLDNVTQSAWAQRRKISPDLILNVLSGDVVMDGMGKVVELATNEKVLTKIPSQKMRKTVEVLAKSFRVYQNGEILQEVENIVEEHTTIKKSTSLKANFVRFLLSEKTRNTVSQAIIIYTLVQSAQGAILVLLKLLGKRDEAVV